MTDIETKHKIVSTAKVLFAEYGYEGTSVRLIATEAGVNIAALNYHFSSKEKLFKEIVKHGYDTCSEEIKHLMTINQGNLEKALVDIFRLYATTNAHDLLSQFKLMMSAQHASEPLVCESKDSFGPPGGTYIAEALLKESPNSSPKDIHWALKTLFSHVTHHAMIFSCCLKNNKDIPYTSLEDFEEGIVRLCRLVISDLKAGKY